MIQSLLTLLGIVLPSLATWILIDRFVCRVDRRIFMLFLLLAIGFVAQGIAPGRITVAVDEVARAHPFAGVVGEVNVRNPLTNDVAKLFLPWMQIARDELFHGNLPLWNRFSFAGYPFLANGESAPFSPFFLLTLFVPLPKQIVAMAGLKLFVGFLFAFLSARRLGASTAAAVFAAVTFTLATSNIVYLYYSAGATTLLLPMVHFASASLAVRRTRAHIALTAVAVWSLLAAGHPESAFHAAFATSVLVIVERLSSGIGWRETARSVLFVAVVALLAAAAGAINWIPVLEQIPHSIRFAEIAAGEKEMSPPMPGMAAWTLLHPDAFGTPVRNNWSWLMNYSVVASSYAGLLALAFVLAAATDPRSERSARLFAFAAITFYVIAMNWTFIGRSVNLIPPFSLVANDKFRFAAAYAAALAAGVRLSQRNRIWAFDQVALIGVGVFALYLSQAKLHLVSQALAPLAIVVIVFGAVLRRAGVMKHAAAAGAMIATLDLFVHGVSFNPPTDQRYFRPSLPVVEQLQRAAPEEPFRVVGFDWVLFPNTAAQYGLEDIRGSDPMGLASYERFLRTFSAPDRLYDISRVQDVEQPQLDFLNVRFLIAEPARELSSERWKLIYRGSDASLYENRNVVPRFFVPHRIHEERDLEAQLEQLKNMHTDVVVRARRSGAVAAPHSLWIDQTRAGRFRMRLESSSPAVVASSQPLSPGWRIRVNGRRVQPLLVNGAFIGFEVPAGRSRIIVDYLPRTVRASLVLMPVGIILLMLLARRNDRRAY